jgi:hypothetical protein
MTSYKGGWVEGCGLYKGGKDVLPQFTVAEITELSPVTESLKKGGLGLGLGLGLCQFLPNPYRTDYRK